MPSILLKTGHFASCHIVPKDAAKAIRKRFSHRDSRTTTLTLKLLETCVKNCGKRFHVHIATKEFMQEMIKIISPKYNPSLDLQNHVLGLIQMWAYAFQSSPELREVGKHYQELKSKGVEFPVLDPELASQTFIPEKSAPSVKSTDVTMPRSSQGNMAMSGGGSMHHHHGAHRLPSGVPVPVQQPTAAPDRVAKLRSELATVQQNCRVFGEILTELSSGDDSQSDVELLEDLNSTCRQMQKRIVELIETCQIEQVTEELLAINDELNNVFLRYDRYQRMRAGRAPAVHSPPDVCPVKPPEYSPREPSPTHVFLPPIYTDARSQPPVSPPPTTSHNTGDVAVGQLIDFDADMPAAAAAPPTNAMANMSIGGPFGSNNAPAVPKSSAQSLSLNDRESDIHEMEAWLQANPPVSTSEPQPGGGGQSVTSAEFDRFLSERVRDAEQLPAVSGANTTTPSSQTNGQSSGQTGELFSL